MKIVSWNCNLGFEGMKPEIIKEFNADILIIPECREMDMESSGYDEKHRDWYGDHKEAKDKLGKINTQNDLGVGVFWKEGITVTPLDKNSDFRYVIPYKVQGNFEPFTLFGVWTKSSKFGLYAYDKNVIQAVNAPEYKTLFNEGAVLIGDFNTFAKKDNGRLFDLQKELSQMTNCTEGTEFHEKPTFFKEEYGFGIDDFCFVSEAIKKKNKINVNVPNGWDEKNRWKGLSDHCPIIVDFDF
jgi:exonuclease III